jgi:hypothetical protein
LFELSQERLAKALRLRAVQQFFVERAVGTDPGAERKMNVKMTNRGVVIRALPHKIHLFKLTCPFEE